MKQANAGLKPPVSGVLDTGSGSRTAANMRIDIINNISEIQNSDRIHIIDEVVHLKHMD